MSEAEEQLLKHLSRFRGRWAGLTPQEVEPTNEPGIFVFLRRCGCAAARGRIIIHYVENGYGVHHHYFRVKVRLWQLVSEERGWPQAGYTLEAFMARWTRL
ncbi:MAG: hypothetical protein V3U11_08505 [Planctomycetota bacterium]